MGRHRVHQWSHLIRGNGTHTGLPTARGNNGQLSLYRHASWHSNPARTFQLRQHPCRRSSIRRRPAACLLVVRSSAHQRFPQRWAGPALGSDHNAGGGHANCSANWTFKGCSNQLLNVVAFRNATLVDSRCWQETPTIHDDSTERVSA